MCCGGKYHGMSMLEGAIGSMASYFSGGGSMSVLYADATSSISIQISYGGSGYGLDKQLGGLNMDAPGDISLLEYKAACATPEKSYEGLPKTASYEMGVPAKQNVQVYQQPETAQEAQQPSNYFAGIPGSRMVESEQGQQVVVPVLYVMNELQPPVSSEQPQSISVDQAQKYIVDGMFKKLKDQPAKTTYGGQRAVPELAPEFSPIKSYEKSLPSTLGTITDNTSNPTQNVFTDYSTMSRGISDFRNKITNRKNELGIRGSRQGSNRLQNQLLELHEPAHSHELYVPNYN